VTWQRLRLAILSKPEVPLSIALFVAIVGRVRATRIATTIGQGFALLLVVAGIWLGDYLLPLVSVFILVAANAEVRFVRIEAALRRLPVGQFALWEQGGIRPDAPLAHAVRDGLKDIAVTQGGQVIGMLWRHDILKHLNGHHHQLRVKDVMDAGVTPVEAADSVYDAHLWLTAANRSAVAVVDGGRYRGIFTHERLAHVYQHIGRRDERGPRRVFAACLARLSFVWR